MCVSSPWSMLLWSGVSAPPPAEVVVTPPETSLSGSLRLALSDSKRTREPERRLMSGDRSDPPGRSSALVGVTVKRTDAIIAHLKETGVEGHYVGEEGRGRRSHGLASRAELSWARLGYFAVDAEVMASSTICPFDAEILHLSKLDFFHTACERKGTTNKCFQWHKHKMIKSLAINLGMCRIKTETWYDTNSWGSLLLSS